MSSALDKLTKESYALKDAGAQKEPSVYVQNAAKYAVRAGISEEHAQATWAWNHLDVELQITIPPSTPTTTLRQFSNMVLYVRSSTPSQTPLP